MEYKTASTITDDELECLYVQLMLQYMAIENLRDTVKALTETEENDA